MKIASGLNSITAAVGGTFVILALSTSTLATEQSRVQQPVEDSFTTSLDDDFDGSFRPTIDMGYDGYLRRVGHDGIDGHDGGDGCSSLFCNNPCPCVYGMVEALFLTREPRLNRQPLVVDQTTNTTLLSNSGYDFNYNPGMRATVGMGLCRGLGMEFTYFGLFEGSDSATAVRTDANSFLTFQDNLVGNAFVDMDRVDVKYSSWINSFAVNLPCCCGCCDEIGCGEVCGESGCGEGGCGDPRCQSLTWFSGFRYLNLGEEYNMSTQRTVAAATENGAYNIRTANHLYGAQLGARIRRTQGRLGWEASGAAGLYFNDAQQSQTVVDFPNFPLRTASNSSSGAAFVGDTNLSALYRLTNVWNLRAGYNLIWIEGLALAPNQLDTNFGEAQGGNLLNNDGGILLHGFNVGIEARW